MPRSGYVRPGLGKIELSLGAANLLVGQFGAPAIRTLTAVSERHVGRLMRSASATIAMHALQSRNLAR